MPQILWWYKGPETRGQNKWSGGEMVKKPSKGAGNSCQMSRTAHYCRVSATALYSNACGRPHCSKCRATCMRSALQNFQRMPCSNLHGKASEELIIPKVVNHHSLRRNNANDGIHRAFQHRLQRCAASERWNLLSCRSAAKVHATQCRRNQCWHYQLQHRSGISASSISAG